MTSDIHVVDGCRTPMGKLSGWLAHVRPDHLAAQAVRSLLGGHSTVVTRV